MESQVSSCQPTASRTQTTLRQPLATKPSLFSRQTSCCSALSNNQAWRDRNLCSIAGKYRSYYRNWLVAQQYTSLVFCPPPRIFRPRRHEELSAVPSKHRPPESSSTIAGSLHGRFGKLTKPRHFLTPPTARFNGSTRHVWNSGHRTFQPVSRSHSG